MKPRVGGSASRETMPRSMRAQAQPLKGRRDDFPLLSGRPGLHYLDSAATSQKPTVVLDAIRGYYVNDNANPHRGAYDLSARATQRYHESRERLAAFVGDEIVLTGMEHHANFVPWQQLALANGAKLRIGELTDDGRIDLDRFRSLLGPRTKVVAFPHVSNALGTINPVREISALVRDRAAGAVIVIDGAQSVPHMRVRVDDLDVDFFAFSGHKMLGPMGIGGLVGRRALLERMAPYQMGGDMIQFVGDDRTTWNVLPHKFEAGTPNVADAVGLAAACDYLDGIGMDAVRAHELELLQAIITKLSAVEGVRIYGPRDLALRSGVVSFTVEGIHPHDLATVLDQNGVCIRAGHHCAQPLMRRLNVPATARASVYVYNDAADVDALFIGVEHAREMFGS